MGENQNNQNKQKVLWEDSQQGEQLQKRWCLRIIIGRLDVCYLGGPTAGSHRAV